MFGRQLPDGAEHAVELRCPGRVRQGWDSVNQCGKRDAASGTTVSPEFGLNFVVGESVGLVLAPYEVYRRVTLAGAIASTLLLGLLYYSLRRSIAERRRHMEEMRLASLVYSSSSEAMVVTSLDGTIINVNPAFAAATGYTLEEIKGRSGYSVSGAGNAAGLVERCGPPWQPRADGAANSRSAARTAASFPPT